MLCIRPCYLTPSLPTPPQHALAALPACAALPPPTSLPFISQVTVAFVFLLSPNAPFATLSGRLKT